MLVTIENTYGASLLGCIVAATYVSLHALQKHLGDVGSLTALILTTLRLSFYGITCAQTCRYFLLFRDDRKALKTMVSIEHVLGIGRF